MEINNTTELIISAIENDREEFINCLKENRERGAVEPGYYNMLKTVKNENSFKTLSTGCQAALLIYVAMMEAAE